VHRYVDGGKLRCVIVEKFPRKYKKTNRFKVKKVIYHDGKRGGFWSTKEGSPEVFPVKTHGGEQGNRRPTWGQNLGKHDRMVAGKKKYCQVKKKGKTIPEHIQDHCKSKT